MLIYYNEKEKFFHLSNKKISYYLGVNDFNYLQHFYFGTYIENLDLKNITSRGEWGWQYLDKKTNSEKMTPWTNFNYYEDFSMMELPVHGGFDKRGAQIVINKPNINTNYTKFIYQSHQIINGKQGIATLPSSFGKEGECMTLEIVLKDELSEAYVHVFYTIFENLDVITRSAYIENKGKNSFNVIRAYSMTLDLPDDNYTLTHFYGDWCKEKNICRRKIHDGKERIQSNYGFTSHNENPVFFLERPDTNENTGEAFAISLMYSSNFVFEIDVNKWNSTRILLGINDEDFSYCLDENEKLFLPEVIISYSSNGRGKLSRTLHDFVRNHINRSPYTFIERGILFNSWEGTTFDFDTKKVCDFIEHSKILNTELFVLDDGWFGQRNDDTTSLGDWWVNTKKIDLNKIIETCHRNNIKFGIWLEPEMISFNSKLYQEHPEYALGLPGINISLGRHQLVLDMTNKEAIENVYAQICDLLDNYKIDYVKIDFNRCLSEVYSPTLNVKHQGEVYHRFMEGAYHLYEMLVNRYQNILFEHCASGGGRFDMGMLYYCPQIQASDSNDAVERVYINYASTYAYPLSCIGSHAFTGALLPYSAKCAIALFGTYGYEMNPLNLTKEDIKQINEAATIYKKYHLDCIQNGDLYRMESPYESNHMSMICVAKNKEKAIAIFFNKRRESNLSRFLKFDGLDDDSLYQNSWDKKIYSGKQIRLIGINLIKWLEEFETIIITFDKVKD